MQYKEIYELLNTIQEAVDFVEGLDKDTLYSQYAYLLEDIAESVRGINANLFDSRMWKAVI